MLLKRIGALLALAFGFLGVIACMGGIYAVWVLASRLEQANDKVFATVDKGLASAQEWARRVQKRVQESRITTAEIDQKFRDWSVKKGRDRLVSQLEIESRAEKLAGHLQTADSWLETAAESIRGAEHVLEVGNSLGASVDPASLEDMLAKLEEIRSRLQQTERSVDRIREFAAGKEDESEASRLARITKLLGRTLLTITEIDTRLEDSIARLAELRTDAQHTQARTGHYILLATIACCLLLAWIAAGQAALCVFGWRSSCRRSC
jgi:hypothetical protein